MNGDRLQLLHRSGTRQTLRLAGAVILVTGGLLALIGLGSVFAATWSFGSPLCSWCAAIGGPLLFAGGGLAVSGYAGAFQP